jgi:hypothetical protein
VDKYGKVLCSSVGLASERIKPAAC